MVVDRPAVAVGESRLVAPLELPLLADRAVGAGQAIDGLNLAFRVTRPSADLLERFVLGLEVREARFGELPEDVARFALLDAVERPVVRFGSRGGHVRLGVARTDSPDLRSAAVEEVERLPAGVAPVEDVVGRGEVRRPVARVAHRGREGAVEVVAGDGHAPGDAALVGHHVV
jgi:hypothetical protein